MLLLIISWFPLVLILDAVSSYPAQKENVFFICEHNCPRPEHTDEMRFL